MCKMPQDFAVDYGTERMPSTVQLLTAQVEELKREIVESHDEISNALNRRDEAEAQRDALLEAAKTAYREWYKTGDVWGGMDALRAAIEGVKK